ncbi:hypothetical protein LBMAG53_05140 [Planctomycetota bacterium]|nr:hypothetical protein LBMAG53_05140 [Planctomycetota bacterium]
MLRLVLLCCLMLAAWTAEPNPTDPPTTAKPENATAPGVTADQAKPAEPAPKPADPAPKLADPVKPAEPPAKAVDEERWYVGDLNGQPAMSMHTTTTALPDGGRRTQAELSVVIKRKLGAQDLRFEVREINRFDEDAAGKLTAFRIDRDENGAASSATGTIEGERVVGTVFRNGLAREAILPIPPGTLLAGDRRMQELLAGATEVGAKLAAAAPTLVGVNLQLVTSTATCTGADPAGHPTFTVLTDIMPVPATLVIDRRGELLSMAMNLGFFTIALRPAPGPPALLGGEVNPLGLVVVKGPAPRAAAVNRYRLPQGATVPSDSFQRQDGDVVTVWVTAPQPAVGDFAALLADEPQIETKDAKMRAWVDGVIAALPDQGKNRAAAAEALRLAVRSHITGKDLGVGDATALETFNSHRGDCTEHAHLLAAALRIAGIPARIEIGLVYSADFGGWCGHAWNSAVVDGVWTHLDSAYPGLARSQYLRLGSAGGGDAAAAKGTTTALMGALAGLLGKTVETLP